MDTYRVRSKLIILGIDLERGTGNISVVSCKPGDCRLPSMVWNYDENHEMLVMDKLSKISGIHQSWIQQKMVGYVHPSSDVSEPTLDLLYTSWIPLDTVLPTHFWMSIDSIEDDDLRNIILRTMQQL